MWFKKKWVIFAGLIFLSGYIWTSWQKYKEQRIITKFVEKHDSWYKNSRYQNLSFQVVPEWSLQRSCKHVCITKDIFSSSQKIYTNLPSLSKVNTFYLVKQACNTNQCINIPNSDYLAIKTNLKFVNHGKKSSNICKLKAGYLISFVECHSQTFNSENKLIESFELYSRKSFLPAQDTISVTDGRRPITSYWIDHSFRRRMKINK